MEATTAEDVILPFTLLLANLGCVAASGKPTLRLLPLARHWFENRCHPAGGHEYALLGEQQWQPVAQRENEKASARIRAEASFFLVGDQ